MQWCIPVTPVMGSRDKRSPVVQSEQQTSTKQLTPTVGGDAEQRELSLTAGGMAN